MNILITTLVSESFQNGLNKYIDCLIKHLQNQESNNRYYILVSEGAARYFSISNTNFVFIPIRIPKAPRVVMRLLYFIWQNTIAGYYYRKYSIDVIHAPNPLPILNTFGVPLVTTIHDVAEFKVKRYSYLRQKIRIWITKVSVKSSSKIITVSNFSKSEIHKYLGVPFEHINVTYLASTLFNKRSSDVFTNKRYFLHVGGHNYNKNTVRLIEAFKGLNLLGKGNLVFVGIPDEKIISEKKMEKLSSQGVFFISNVIEEDLIKLYDEAIALVYPSIYEGFGLPILEAMACGTPVITSNITSMPEIGGDAVHYVDPYSVVSIREGMEKIWNDCEYRNSLIQKGLTHYAEFSWDDAARKTMAVYEKAGKD